MPLPFREVEKSSDREAVDNASADQSSEHGLIGKLLAKHQRLRETTIGFPPPLVRHHSGGQLWPAARLFCDAGIGESSQR